MKQDNSKQRLFEVMQRLDKTFKPRLNEEFDSGTDDPTKEEMVNLLTHKFQGVTDPMETDANEFDIESAIYWFANDYHGGQNSNLYSALSTSQFRPGPSHKGIEDEESEIATEMYQELVNQYGGGQEQEVDNSQWMGMSMNEKDGVEEDISVDVKVGDTIMTGRFKNKRTVVKSIGKDEHGMPTINGKKVVTFRKGVDENIHNTPMMGGILNSKGTAGYDPDASNRTYKDNLIYNNSRNPNIQGTTVTEPIIPDAIDAIQANPDAKQFYDKQSYDEFANQQQYFSASHSHCFYSPEEQQEWSKNGGKYDDPDSEQSDILFDTGHELVQVWDNKNNRGYVVPSERNKESVKEGDAFNDAGEPNMTHSQFRDHSEPAEPDYDDSYDMPIQNKGMGRFTDIDWKVVHDIFVHNTEVFKQGNINQGTTVNDLTDYDGYLSPEELQHLDDHSLVYIDGQNVVFDNDQYLDYNTFLTKAQQIWGTEADIHNSGGNDSEAPYMRGYEPMSENVTKKRLFEMMYKINPNSKII